MHSTESDITSNLKVGQSVNTCVSFQVFNDDIFGEVAEEKDVQGIVGKLFEARSTKGYDCYEMVAKFVGQGSLTQLILPLKEVSIQLVKIIYKRK